MAPSYNSLDRSADAPHCPSSPPPPPPPPPFANPIPTSPSPPPSLSPHSSTPAPAPTFPLFATLPPELRLKIWTLTLPPPRLVPLTYQSSTAPISQRTPRSHRGCTSPAALPAALHINHESRALALQHYSLSFGLPGGIAYPGARASSLPCKIYFSADRGDVLFFGAKENRGGNGGGENEGMKAFVNACMMVQPGASGFGQVRRLAVQKGVFTANGKGVSEMQLMLFWERVRRKFGGVQEVVFVERGSDALGAFKGESEGESECEDIGRGRGEMEDICYADDGLGFNRWEESFEEKVERVVGSVKAECGWSAPRWRVLGPQQQGLDTRMKSMAIDRRTRKEKEEMLVRQMRDMFGHEDISNAS